MATVKLIVSTAYIKDSTILTENVDEKYIRAAIETAQDLYIETTLGTLLFNDIVDKATAGTLAGDDLTLYNKYIKPTIRFYALHLLAYDLLVKWQNKSLATKSSDNAQPIDYNEMVKIATQKKNLGDEYRQRMINYLCENDTLFPLYDDNDGADEIQPTKKTNQTNIYLG